jgi:uncharacterized protein (PEP-CTERM system associated)
VKTHRHLRRDRSLPHWCMAILSASIGNLAFAQQVQFTPSVTVSETITDNVALKSASAAESDMVTVIRPSIFVSRKGGVVEGSLQAMLNGAYYANGGKANKGYLTLRGTGRVEAWENHGFVDLSASISQEALSAFGPQSADNVTGSGNQGDARNFLLSPYLTGRFGSTGKADLRYTYNETEVSNSTIQNMQRHGVSANLSDPKAFGMAGWSLALMDNYSKTTNRRDLKTQSIRATGLLQLDPQLLLRAIVGSEANNYRSDEVSRSTIMGVGADWTISPLTKFSALWEDRFFGPGYLLSGQHRSGRFLFTGSYSKDVSSTSQSLSGNTMINTFDFLMSAMEGLFPDEAERTTQVRNYIASNQLPDKFAVSQAVLSNGTFLDHRLRVGVSITGERNSLLFSGYRSERNSLTDRSFSLGGDFEQTDKITQTGGSAILSHRLTPITSANFGVVMTRSQRDSTAASIAQSSRSRILTAALSTKFTPNASGSLTLRNNRGEGTTSYTENAVIGAISLRF